MIRVGADTILEKIRNITPDRMVAYGYLTRSRDGKIVCPHCGNGTGEDGTGCEMNQLSTKYQGFCHKCGERFDNFDAIMIKENCDFDRAIEIAERVFFGTNAIVTKPAVITDGILDDWFAQREREKALEEMKVQQFDNNDERKYEKLIRLSQTYLHDFMVKQGGTWRGFSENFLAKFGVGYLEEAMPEKLPRVIVPTSYAHYLGRLAVEKSSLPAAYKDVHEKQHFGKKDIFNRNNVRKNAGVPIFVVEGEFDAMSIELTGYPAIALCGSDLSRRMADQLSEFPAETMFIVMFDEDATGQGKTQKVSDKIKSLPGKNFFVTISRLQGAKDANDLLQKNPDALRDELQKIYAKAERTFAGEMILRNKKIAEVQEFEDAQGQTTAQVFSNCPVNVKVPEGFFIREDGVFREQKGSYFRVTATPIVVTHQLISHEYNKAHTGLAYYDRRSKKWREILVANTQIADSRKIYELTDCGISLEQGMGKHLSAYLVRMSQETENLEKIKEYELSQRPGWADNGEFIYPQEKTPGVSNILDPSFDYVGAFSAKGSKEESQNMFEEILFHTNYIARTTIGAAVAPLVLDLVNVRNGQIHLTTPSGGGKSAIAKFAMSLFGNTTKLHNTYNGTANYIDQLGPRFNCLPCWVDEFQAADENVRDKKVDTLIYNYAEGVTKGRLNKNAVARPVKPYRGVKISTGEQPLTKYTSGEGAKNRVFELNSAVPILEDAMAVRIHRLVERSYGHFGKAWAEYVSAHRNEIKDDFRRLEGIYLSEKEINAAYTRFFAVIHTSMAHFCKMIGVYSQKVEAILIDDFRKLCEQTPSRLHNTNAVRAIRDLAETRFSDTGLFKREVSENKYEDIGSSSTPKLGLLRMDGDMNLYPRQFRKWIKECGYPSESAIINQWSEMGIFNEPDKLSKAHPHQRPVHIEGEGTVYTYVIRAEMLQVYAGATVGNWMATA